MMKLFVLLSLLSLSAFAHRGGQERSGALKGCHKSDKDYHCHSKSKFNGMSWKSKAQARTHAIKNTSYTIGLDEVSKYSRHDWGGWSDDDKDCKDSRAEVLEMRSKAQISYDKRGCTVRSGKWKDFFSGKQIVKANDIDIDHVVPLKEAFDSGGDKWSADKKKKFANDPENLVITHLSINRSKGSRDISKWPKRAIKSTCKYFRRYLEIKNKYGLKIKTLEANRAKKLCPHNGKGQK